jgi:uncharacterized membrane protein YwzB
VKPVRFGVLSKEHYIKLFVSFVFFVAFPILRKAEQDRFFTTARQPLARLLLTFVGKVVCQNLSMIERQR